MGALKLGIAGLGCVGCGLVELVKRQSSLRLPGNVEIAGVSAQTRERNRPVAIDDYTWFDDPVLLAASADIDIFVELIGGATSPAKDAVEAALKAGKPVVTANKALIAKHGTALAKLAADAGVDLLFEAAVAGGIPVVRVLRDSLAGVEVTRVSGILNGTCNYITTEILASGRSYADVFAEAKALGFLEADPSLDIDGIDAAHKAVILSAIAFSADPDFSCVSMSGIDGIDLLELRLADRLGLRIKLIAEGRRTQEGIVCRVAPAALPIDHPLARIDGSLNTVRIEGDPVGAITLTGPGAGAGPTASAVMGDIAKLFRPAVRPAFGRAAHHKANRFITGDGSERSAWFVYAALKDEPGALAGLSEALASENVSVDKLLQDSADDAGSSPVAIVTHVCSRDEITRAMQRLSALDTCVDTPRHMPVEKAGSRA